MAGVKRGRGGGVGIWARESKFPLPLLTGGHEGYGFVTLDIILKRVYTSVLCNKHILIAKKQSLKKVASDSISPTFTLERTVP